jgi:hypothetical protein
MIVVPGSMDTMWMLYGLGNDAYGTVQASWIELFVSIGNVVV